MKLSRTVILTTIVVVAIALCVSALLFREWRRGVNRMRPVPASAVSVADLQVGAAPPLPAPVGRESVPELEVTEIARNLEIVWSIRSSPDGRLFVTERSGRILLLKPGSRALTTYARVSTALGGESGLTGLALHPAFPWERWVYVMYTARKAGGGVNRVSRFVDKGDFGAEEHVLLDDIPAANSHDGGALEFGPDGMLYVGTGDAGSGGLAQDLSQPSGKILRITPEGVVPSDNPFRGSPIWAYGFRNVSGLAFHPSTGELWAASHGPSSKEPGKPKHMDSVYRVRKGANHGWPAHLGVSADPGIISPVIAFGDRPVPPGGLAFYNGPTSAFTNSLFMTSLGAQELHRYVIAGGQKVIRFEQWWSDRFGRLRAVAVAADGSVYVGTSNADGKARGRYPGSDFIYRVRPADAAPDGE